MRGVLVGQEGLEHEDAQQRREVYDSNWRRTVHTQGIEDSHSFVVERVLIECVGRQAEANYTPRTLLSLSLARSARWESANVA